MNHSPEPWKFCGGKRKPLDVCGCLTIWSGPGDHPIASMESGEWGDSYPSIRMKEGTGELENQWEAYMKMESYGEIPEEAAKANVRRIVACVNACAGIPTEELEAMTLGQLKELLTKS